MTDHEKLRVHSRPSSEFLVAMPIKKRRFILPPSTPHESPSPSLGDRTTPERKPESSELGLPCSKNGVNPAEVNIVRGEASCEFHDPPLRTAGCAIPEVQPESLEAGSLFQEIRGTPAQVNLVTGNGSSEPCELPSPAWTDHFIPEKKPVSPSSRNGGNPFQVNAMTGENASCNPLQTTGAGCGISDRKYESSEFWSPFSKTGVNPIEVSDVAGQNTSHGSCTLPSPTTQADGISEKKSELPSKPESPFSKTGGNPAQVNSITGKVASSESSGVPMTRDLNICPKPEILPTFHDQGSWLNLATNSQDGTGEGQEMVLNSKCAAAWLVNGSMVIPSAATHTFTAPGMEGNVESKLTPSRGSCVKQEVSEITSSETKYKAESSHLSLNRSNWNLNTTMDAWEGSAADSLLNNGATDSGRRDLGGIQNKRFELGLKQVLFKEPSGTDMSLKNYELQKNNHQPKLPSRCSPVVDSNLDCLDLHLKPSFLPNPCITSGKRDASREMPFLSLGMKPALSTFSQPLAIGRTVKSEPIENGQKNSGNVQSGVLKSQDLKHVKSEPCKGQQISKKTIPDNMNLACSRAIKPEPLESQSLGCVRSSEGSPFHVEQKSHTFEVKNPLVHYNACKDDSKALDAFKPPVSCRVLHTWKKRPNTNISNDSSDLVDKGRGLVNQASPLGNDISVTTAITQYSNGIATEPSALGSESLVSDGNDMSSLPEACETSSLPVSSLPATLASNGEDVSAEGAAELVVQMDASNTRHSPNASLTDEVLGKPCANSKIVESDEVEGKAGISSEVIDEPCDSTCKSDGSHVAAGTINSVRKQCDKADDDYEDGEVRYPALNGMVEGSCVVVEEQEVKDADFISPIDAPASTALPVDEKETKVDSSKEGNALSSNVSDDSVLENKVEPSSAVGALSVDSGKRSLCTTICRDPEDHLKNNKDLERKLKSRDLSSKIIPSDSQSGANISEQQNVEGVSIAKNYVSSKTESSEKVGAARDANDRGNRRIIYLNSASNCLASGKRKSTLERITPSQGAGERAVDRSFRRERSHSLGSRDESTNERSQKVESQRHYGHPVENCRSDFLRMRSRTDRLNSLHGDRNANSEHLLEQVNISNGIRYSRPISAAEVAIGASPDGSNRLTRNLASEEMQNPSRLPCQRQSPGGRVQIPLGRHPIRDISTSRSIERDVPDFAVLAHEEKLLRNLPEDMAEHSMLSHSHLHSQYERAEGIILHRDRSVTPPLRRGGALQIPPNCQKSSPRSQQYPTHQWSPPRRTSDGFRGQRDLGRCRSPPIMRINRMQSSCERPCFAEEVIVRRQGCSPYIARLPNDMVDVAPSREHEFPRVVRGLNRNMRRFNMIDPREMMEDAYLCPPLVHSQIREFDVDDEFVDDRSVDERWGPIHPFRQRYVTGDNEGESFRFHDEDSPPRGLRLHPDAIEGFPEDGSPRDFDVRFRNRLGNPSGRLRGIAQEQEDNYRRHGEHEWRDTAFNDGRTKRRRF